MDYATDHTRFDPFNFRRYEAEVAQDLPVGLAKILYILGGRMSWSRDNERYPFGTVSGLSVPHLADLCQMSLSTVQAHLAEAKRRGILAAEMICDTTGRCLGLRYRYPGFVRWLREGCYQSRRDETRDTEPGVQPVAGGGSDRLDPNNIRSSNKIIEDGLLNLEYEGPVSFTEVADAIREAKPLVNGQAADPNKVWSDFRAFNRKKGHQRLSLQWLLGFCRVYGRKFSSSDHSTGKAAQPQTRTGTPEATFAVSAVPLERPQFSENCPLDRVGRQIFETKGPNVWLSWIKPLRARLVADRWVIEAPSAFHSGYVRREFEGVFERVFGPNSVHFAQG